MAIQMRQGNEVDFDAEKMLPGEWAVSKDARIVRMCFAPGIVARMATYEAFEADMVKIEAILKNVQDIQTAVKLVQVEINGKSELVAENASLAEEYMLKAKEYAEQAGAFTGMQIAKRDLLGVVKGGDMAVEDDGSLRNFKRGAGNTFAVSDTVESPFSAYKLYGKSVQDGVPTPDNPQPIVNVGEKLVDGVVTDVGIWSEVCGKNLLKNTATSQTLNGVTFTVNSDGSVVANGTSTAAMAFALDTKIDNIKIGSSYILNGCPSGGSTTTYRLIAEQKTSDNTTLVTYQDIGSDKEFVIRDTCAYLWVGIHIQSGVTVSNLTFKPMLRLASIEDDTYVPYVEPQNHTLNRTLRAIPVTDPTLANYTDESGQMWVADTIEEVDGKMCLVERVCHKKLTKDLPMSKSTTTAIDRYLVRVDNTATPSGYAGYCSHAWLKSNSSVYFNSFRYDLNDGSTRFAIDYAEAGTTDLDTFKTFLGENDVYCGYILATPIVTELTAEEVSAIESLHSYNGVTTVMSDAWAEVECATSNVAALAMYIKRDYVPKAKYDALESRISALEQQIVNA